MTDLSICANTCSEHVTWMWIYISQCFLWQKKKKNTQKKLEINRKNGKKKTKNHYMRHTSQMICYNNGIKYCIRCFQNSLVFECMKCLYLRRKRNGEKTVKRSRENQFKLYCMRGLLNDSSTLSKSKSLLW